jgi:MFS family permease
VSSLTRGSAFSVATAKLGVISGTAVGIKVDSRSVWLVLFASICQFANFQILLPVAPVLAERADRGGAGLANAALLGATVAFQVLTPWVLRRHSHARVQLAGLLLMGVPALAYAASSHSLGQMLVIAAMRGAGFGLSTVASAALIIELAPPSRRGTYLGHFGLTGALPAIVMPPFGLQLLAAAPIYVIAVITAGLGVAGAVCLLWVRAPERNLVEPAVHGWLGLREPGLRLFAAAFLLVSFAWGGTVTFLPVALPSAGYASAAVFLLVSGVLRAAGRFVSGVLADRAPKRAVLLGSLVATVAGLAFLPAPPSPLTILVAAILYGIGSGSFQTSVYLAMLDRVTSVDFGGVSALWNTSIDFGGLIATLALGALAVAGGGYGAVMLAMPVVVAVAIPIVALVRPINWPLAGQ